MHSLEKALTGIDWLLARITAVAILLVMAIIVADVVGRYFFSHPISWVYDIVSIYFINLVLYFLASETLRTGAHIALDLRVRLLLPAVWTMLQAFAWAAVAVALGLAAWRVSVDSLASLNAGEVHPGLYEWPVWIEKGIVAVGLVLLVCRIVLRLLHVGLSGPSAGLFDSDEAAADMLADEAGMDGSGAGENVNGRGSQP